MAQERYSPSFFWTKLALEGSTPAVGFRDAGLYARAELATFTAKVAPHASQPLLLDTGLVEYAAS